ncbi:hypothetical protein TNCV_745491 [Trichonephila clavipes]|nr:hypothetical protein TNCV_745491 [Trichonephila clavipes]
MTIVFVCGDPMVNDLILPLLYSDTPLPQLVLRYGVLCLQYTFTSCIDPLYHDSPAVSTGHPATICVTTHATAPRSHFFNKSMLGVTWLSLHCYYPSLACSINRLVSNRANMGSFGTMSWASHEHE